MPFEALSFVTPLEFQNVPPEWSPLVFPFDPDLPLFPLLYFHVLASDLDGERPRIQDRAYGYIRSELIMTHFFCTRFGEPVASSNTVPYVEFHLLPTWQELTDGANPMALFPRFRNLVAR